MAYLISEQKVLQILNKLGAVITDSHFVYASGKHGSAYVNKDALFPHVRVTELLCREIAINFAWLRYDIDTVIAPVIGAVILAQRIAYHLGDFTGRDVNAVYAEKSPDGNAFIIKRGFDRFVTGRRILVVEDILNTGGSAKKVVDAARAFEGHVQAVATLCNRGGVTKEALANVPEIIALINVAMDAWEESVCPLCAQKVPINTDFGHGREFLSQRERS